MKTSTQKTSQIAIISSLITTALFFAITCSFMDQQILGNDFNWTKVWVSSLAGMSFVLISAYKQSKNND